MCTASVKASTYLSLFIKKENIDVNHKHILSNITVNSLEHYLPKPQYVT